MFYVHPPAGNTVFQFNDSINVNGLQGALIESIPNRQIQLLNGFNVLNYVTNSAADIVPQITNPYNQLFLSEFTIGAILKQSGTTAGRHCLSMRGNFLPAGDLNFNSFTQGVVANKLSYFLRTNNGQSITVNSVTNWNGAGFQIVFVSYNSTTKTVTMYENGNTIAVTNALQDNLVYSVPNRYFSLMTNALNVPGGWWIGGIGEFFYYSDVKNVSVINRLGKYFSLKYSLPFINC